MKTLSRIFREFRHGPDKGEDEKMARLEKAEAEMQALLLRADIAIEFLDGRRNRNHWRESIEKMIGGVA